MISTSRYDAVDRGNLVLLARLLAYSKAYPRGVEAAGLPLSWTTACFHGAPILTLTSTEGDIDVMDRIAGDGPYAEVRKHSERITALGVRSEGVLDLPLIKRAVAAGRPRDFEHLPELEALLA